MNQTPQSSCGSSSDRILDPNNVMSSRIIEMIPDWEKIQRSRRGIGSTLVRLGKKFGCVRGNQEKHEEKIGDVMLSSGSFCNSTEPSSPENCYSTQCCTLQM